MNESTPSKAEHIAAFEAVINGDEIATIDPIVRVIIDNGFHYYEFTPDEMQTLVIRPLVRETK